MSTKSPAKKPQDFKPKQEKPTVESVEVTVGEAGDERTVPARRVTIAGVTVTVLDEALDDFEVLDDMRALQDNQDASRMPSLLRRLLDGDDYRSVMDGIRGDNGRVSIEAGVKFVWELISALNPN